MMQKTYYLNDSILTRFIPGNYIISGENNNAKCWDAFALTWLSPFSIVFPDVFQFYSLSTVVVVFQFLTPMHTLRTLLDFSLLLTQYKLLVSRSGLPS